MIRTATAALVLAFAAPAAMAAQPASDITIPVTAADLNDSARLAEIEARISEAAATVCRDRVRNDLLRPYTMRQCVQATTEHAMAQLDARRGVAPASAARQQIASRDR